jgi:type II pantothenate kinase
VGIIAGIDIGGSTTKIVGINGGGNIITPLQVRANDPIASVFGAFGKFLDVAGYSIKNVDTITVTGVGSSFITKPIYGIPTYRVLPVGT